MTRSTGLKENILKDTQKRLILWALVFFAVLFHILFCEWQVFNWKRGDNKGAMIAELWDGDSYDSSIRLYAHAPAGSRGSSLFAKSEPEESNQLAIPLGIIAPLLLLTARIYFQLGWFDTVFVGSRLKRACCESPIEQKPPEGTRQS